MVIRLAWIKARMSASEVTLRPGRYSAVPTVTLSWARTDQIYSGPKGNDSMSSAHRKTSSLEMAARNVHFGHCQNMTFILTKQVMRTSIASAG